MCFRKIYIFFYSIGGNINFFFTQKTLFSSSGLDRFICFKQFRSICHGSISYSFFKKNYTQRNLCNKHYKKQYLTISFIFLQSSGLYKMERKLFYFLSYYRVMVLSFRVIRFLRKYICFYILLKIVPTLVAMRLGVNFQNTISVIESLLENDFHNKGRDLRYNIVLFNSIMYDPQRRFLLHIIEPRRHV